MIWLELFLGFLKVGCFAFGGAYGAIPLIRDVVLSYDWISEEQFLYFVAVSESTPGPIMVNLATYVGSMKGGILGAALATLAVVLPSFLIVLLVAMILKTLLKKPLVQAALRGIKPCIIGIILAAGGCMVLKNCLAADGKMYWNLRGTAITVILSAAAYGYKRMKKKQLSGISLILISAVLGIVIYW